jgi:hypothetical protein
VFGLNSIKAGQAAEIEQWVHRIQIGAKKKTAMPRSELVKKP